MKIQKGMVKYKDRNDIICIYGVTEDGKTYYFLNSDGKAFNNGNFVASTELVEAIDPMYKASKVGVIDPEGKEVIACENKGVKPITDEVILVEKAVSTTESVLQAIEHRSDSLYAAQLVSTPAQIKDKIYREMGNDGRFLFNDQFAEATVYDINGNNLVNGEVYSFIAMNNDKLYLSKNVPESPVEHFSLVENKEAEPVASEPVQEEVTATETVEVTNVNADAEVPAATEEKIDVNDVNVPMDVVENALEGQQSEEHNVIQDNFDVDVHTPLENVNEGLELPSSADFLAATDVGMPVVHEDEVSVENTTAPVEGEVVQEGVDSETTEVVEAEETMESHTTDEVVAEVDESYVDDAFVKVTGEAVESPAEEETTQEDGVVEETPVEEIVTESTDDIVPNIDDALEKVTEEVVDETTDVVEDATEDSVPEDTVVEEEVSDAEDLEEEVALHIDDATEQVEDVVEDNVTEEAEAPLDEKDIQTLLDETSMDLFNGTPLQIDSIVNGTGLDDLDSYTFSIPETVNSDNIFDDVAKSMAELIKQVREQRATIANYEGIIDGLNADNAELQGKNAGIERQIVELSDRNRTLENAVVKLKTRIEMLASKNQEKDRLIDDQGKEIQKLKAQSAGKQQLISLLRDAKALISDDTAAMDDVEEFTYMKAA